MAFFLGFDAGGTKTTCASAHDTHVLARDAGGSIKPLRVSIEHAGQNLAALLGEIVKQSGVDSATFPLPASEPRVCGYRKPMAGCARSSRNTRVAKLLFAATKRSRSTRPFREGLEFWPWLEQDRM